MSHFADFKAGDLYSHLPQWRRIGAPTHVLSWIANGVSINAENVPGRHFSNQVKFGPQALFVAQEIKDLVACGALRSVINPPSVVSPLKTVPKKGEKKYRLITDLRFLNQFCKVPKFSNEDIRTVFDIIEPGDLMITLDLKSAFQHISICDSDQDLLGISFRNKYYVWQVLPFGSTVSPYYCHKLLRPVIQYLREQGLRLVLYVDDIILCAQPGKINEHKDLLLQTLQALGLYVNLSKSQLTPSHEVQFIGYKILTSQELPRIEIPKDRVYKLKKDLRRALRLGTISARFLARILGQCVSMTRAILPGKLLLRNAFRLLQSKDSWDADLCLDAHSKKDLNWWLSSIDNWNGRPIIKSPIDCQIVTDASGQGWGAHMNGKRAFGVWDSEIRYSASNVREMFAVLAALKSFQNQITGKHVQVLSDNISTVAYLNNLGGSSAQLSKIATATWLLCHHLKVTLTVRHISGKRNVLADRLSRRQSAHEWCLAPHLFRILDIYWGPHTIDRFASMMSTQLDTFNSLAYDPLATGIDAFAQTDWSHHNNFVNAPFRLIPRVLDLVVRQGATATLIAPWWPSQTWFHRLRQLSIAPPVHLGGPLDVVVPLTDCLPEPLKNAHWQLFAWRICGLPSCTTEDGPDKLLPDFH